MDTESDTKMDPELRGLLYGTAEEASARTDEARVMAAQFRYAVEFTNGRPDALEGVALWEEQVLVRAEREGMIWERIGYRTDDEEGAVVAARTSMWSQNLAKAERELLALEEMANHPEIWSVDVAEIEFDQRVGTDSGASRYGPRAMSLSAVEGRARVRAIREHLESLRSAPVNPAKELGI